MASFSYLQPFIGPCEQVGQVGRAREGLDDETLLLEAVSDERLSSPHRDGSPSCRFATMASRGSSLGTLNHSAAFLVVDLPSPGLLKRFLRSRMGGRPRTPGTENRPRCAACKNKRNINLIENKWAKVDACCYGKTTINMQGPRY